MAKSENYLPMDPPICSLYDQNNFQILAQENECFDKRKVCAVPVHPIAIHQLRYTQAIITQGAEVDHLSR